MEDLLDVLEHLVAHARGYATIADRDAHLHVIAEIRKAYEETGEAPVPRMPPRVPPRRPAEKTGEA